MSIPPTHPIRRKFLPVGFLIMGTITLMVAVLAFGRTGVVNAKSSDQTLFVGKYSKTAGTKLDSCTLCHTSSIPALNSYGAAYKSHGYSTSAFGLIEALDSDGDGYTNLQEINALTYPGSSSDHPVAAPTATKAPTLAPTATKAPTLAPTATKAPTLAPTATKAPTLAPTATRTTAPTATKTAVPPTATSTKAPTSTNTAVPLPSSTPMATNTSVPTQAPTATWTMTPTATLTSAPTSQPTATPTRVRKTPRPLPTCQYRKSEQHTWFELDKKNCGRDDDHDGRRDD